MLPDPKTKTGPLLNSATGLAFISAGGLVTSKRQMHLHTAVRSRCNSSTSSNSDNRSKRLISSALNLITSKL
jgi:hypothetical protein